MQDVYLNKIVDITDEQCLFIREFNSEIRKYGAIVYNQEFNSYQFIRSFEMIDCKKELLPDFIKIEDATALKALKMTVHYEFDPLTEEDPENLEIWQELKQMEIPVFNYGEDGEAFVEKTVYLNNTPSVHMIWFLKPESFDYILDTDLLLLYPYIKNVEIARTLITKYGIHPFEAQYDPDDLNDYTEPDLSAYFALEGVELVDEDDPEF
ncbi:MAG: hypothetical protein II126_05405 [Erysipelotrichaceae bacterium]|nr:hypothetical protein [Erysipelotrichaceae bacterium]